ncbi:MAG: hypothetical protein IKH63_02990 [Prevotella sp.]|nr:hypothetical protein [Prevotella sp.]
MKIDEIDKYLAGEMTAEERASFEKEMEHDAKQREDVRIIAFIIHGIKQVGLEEDNQRLQRLIASSASDKQRYIATIAAIFIAGFIIAATISVPIYNHVVKPLIEKVSKNENSENNNSISQSIDSLIIENEEIDTTLTEEKMIKRENHDKVIIEKKDTNNTNSQYDDPIQTKEELHINSISKTDENGTNYKLFNAYYEKDKLILFVQIVNNNNDRDLVFENPTILDDKGNQYIAINMKLNGQNKNTFSLNRTQVLEMILTFKVNDVPRHLQELKINDINSWPLIRLKDIDLR